MPSGDLRKAMATEPASREHSVAVEEKLWDGIRRTMDDAVGAILGMRSRDNR